MYVCIMFAERITLLEVYSMTPYGTVKYIVLR